MPPASPALSSSASAKAGPAHRLIIRRRRRTATPPASVVAGSASTPDEYDYDSAISSVRSKYDADVSTTLDSPQQDKHQRAPRRPSVTSAYSENASRTRSAGARLRRSSSAHLLSTPSSKVSSAAEPAANAATAAAEVDSQYVKDSRSIHSLPAHKKVIYSPLAKEAPEQSYRGLVNLAGLVLFISNLRLLIENFHKYGLLVTLPGTAVPASEYLLFWGGMLFHVGNILFAYVCELEASQFGPRYYCAEKSLRFWWRMNLVSVLLVPTLLVYFCIAQPVLGTALLCFSTCLFLKLLSYHLVNAELRYFMIYRTSIASYSSSPYPRNITLRNMLEFIAFPTLCYQPVYPRLPHYRLRKIFRYSAELVISASLMYFMVYQYVSPVLQNTVRYITDPSTGAVNMSMTTAVIFVERLLKLSVNVIYIWLLMFYALFHCYLNLLAELTLFGDREFYLAWWNCSTIAAYWRLWNQPIHTWLKRHVYIPMVSGNGLPDPFTEPAHMFAGTDDNRGKKRKRYSKFQAALVIFLISAVFHELVIAVPVKIFRLHAFNAMFLQIPLIILTQVIDVQYRRWRPEGVNTIGNVIMWCSFCVVGQPMGAMMYYIEWCGREKCLA
ncbi:hypothetical protein RI367_001211 [Sorochytrium milnesiophthora]